MGTSDTLKIIAYFTDSGKPKNGLSPTINIWKSDGTLVVSSGSMTELAGGFYTYSFTSSDNSLDYAFRADGGASLSGYDRYVYGTNEIDRVNSEVWEEPTSDHTTVGTTGLKQLQIESVGGVLNTGLAFEFKKIQDNFASKKEIKEFFDKLSKFIEDKTKKEEENKETEQVKISKMSSDLSDKINKLSENSKNHPKLINGIKKDLTELSKKITESDKSFEKVNNFNKEILNMVKIIQNKELLELNNKVNDTSTELKSVKEDNIRNSKDIINKILGISDFLTETTKSYNQSVSKFQENENTTKEEVLNEFKTVKENMEKLSKQVENKKVELILNTKCDSKLVDQNTQLNKDIKEGINNNYQEINKLFGESNSKLTEIDNLLKSDSKDKSSQINSVVDKISNKITEVENSISGVSTDVNSVIKLSNDFVKMRDNLKEMSNKLADKRDVNYISSEVDDKFSKINKQMTIMRDSIKEKLIEISKKADVDDSDIDSQLKLLGLDTVTNNEDDE